MSFSINTNNNALAALESLNVTQQAMTKTQNRVSSGLKVATAADDASTFAIAQGQRGDIAGFLQVSNSLAFGSATVNVALQGATAISDLLNQLKAKVIQGTGASVSSQTAIFVDVNSLLAQINSTSASAQFNGINLINSATATDSVLSSLNRTATGVTTAFIPVASSDLTTAASGLNLAGLGGPGVPPAAGTFDQTGLNSVEGAIAKIETALSSLGAAANQLTTQSNFVKNLTDTLTTGVGTLVDADLAAESANLQSLQTKQQLGIQALSIANQGPGAILTLFR